MKPKIAINGFGRIGREILRINLEKNYFDVIAINDLSDAKTMAHLLEFDSNYGRLKKKIEVKSEKEIKIEGKSYQIFTEMDPEKLPWKKLKIDYVLECTGVFRDKAGAGKHLSAGAKRVIVSAPGKDLEYTVVMGVNEKKYNPKIHTIISNASCTTNGLAPVVKVLNDNFGIEKGLMTTIHSYTNDQNILDLPHKDLRRARAAALSIIPTTTGAAQAVGLVIPELAGKFNGISMRVPTPTVSIVDLVCVMKKKTSVEEVNLKLKKASNGYLKGIMEYCEKPLVSIDFKGDENSSIIDALSTEVIGGNMVKVLAWYDNEWGYSARMVDLVKYMWSKEK